MKRLLGLLTVFLSFGCSGSPPPEPALLHREPTPLLGPFAGYQTLEHARELVPDARWTVLQDSRAEARGRCPRFDAYSISTRWQHLGQPGELRLDFVNGVLYRSAFYADDPEAYLGALAASGRRFPELDSVGTPSERLPPRTKLWHGTAHDRRRCVGWMDEALTEEINDWISACS